MITMEQAYASGPDGVVDISPGSVFQQYMAQQNVNNANVGMAPGNPTLTQGQQYMALYPDVQQDAIGRANAEGLFGGDAYSNRLDEIAQEHFNLFGVADGRTGFGYTPPEPGTFTPSPNDTPMFGPPPGNTVSGPPPGNTVSGPPPGNTVSGPPPGNTSTFDNSAYQTALGNFGGLLNSYGDFFGGLLSGAQNAGTAQPATPANGFYAPGQMPNYFGFNAGQNFTGTMGGGYGGSGGWNAGPSGGGGFGGAANTGHRQLWTT